MKQLSADATSDGNSASIRAATAKDAQQIASIYDYYILNTHITFEETSISVEEMQNRIAEVQQGQLPWLVYERDAAIEGFAYASKWKGRCAYRYAVETTIYVRHESVGRGIGVSLYTQLIQMLRDKKLHVAIGGIAQPNDVSVALHEKFGFAKVAHFSEVGWKFNRWIDVGYWQLNFDK